MTLQELYQKATPLPWKVDEGRIKDSRGGFCLRPIQGPGPLVDVQEARAALQLVAHAVNVLPELVEALEAAQAQLKHYCPTGKELGGVHADDVMKQVTKALKKANHIETK